MMKTGDSICISDITEIGQL